MKLKLSIKRKLLKMKNNQWIRKKIYKIKKRKNRHLKNNKRIRKQKLRIRACKMMIYSLIFFETDKYV
jgi:hypothetical protein